MRITALVEDESTDETLAAEHGLALPIEYGKKHHALRRARPAARAEKGLRAIEGTARQAAYAAAYGRDIFQYLI